MFVQKMSSPLGQLTITANNTHLLSLTFGTTKTPLTSNKITEEAAKQLGAFFLGKLKVFNLPLDPFGTEFQKKVWQALENIPYGKTMSYLALAKRLGNPKVIRAAATANGKNPIPIIIPCHRVIGSDNSLTGYSSGLDKKKMLLELEGSISPDLFS